MIRGTDRAVRQVRAPQVLVDVAVVNPASYELRFYPIGQAGSRTPSAGTYAVSGSPLVVHRIENPDAAQGILARLRVSELRGSSVRVSEYSRDPATGSWALSSGGGLRREEETTVQINGERVVTRVVREADGSIVSESARTYHSFAWGEELVREVVDPAGAALTTSYVFHDGVPASDPNYRRLRQRIDPQGGWERFFYDSQGRTIRRVAPFLAAGPDTTDEALCRTTEWVYDSLPDADGDGVPESRVAILSRTLGRETARRYRIDWSRQVALGADLCRRQSEVVCTALSAGWDAPDNLVTETLTYAEGPFSGRERRITRPDGTVVLTSHVRSSEGSLTTVEQHGAPAAGGDSVVDGQTTTTVLSPLGQPQSVRVVDAASGLLLGGWTATAWDNLGRPTRLDYTDGTHVLRTYDCCGLLSERDRSGQVTAWTYDALGRPVSMMRGGIGLRTTWDAASRPLSRVRVGADGSEMTQELNRYDRAGRRVERRDALGRMTSFAEVLDPVTGQLVRTTTAPDGATTVETWARDGTLLALAGTAVAPRRFEPGVDAEGIFLREIAVGTTAAVEVDLSEWAKSYVDFCGRPCRTVFADGAQVRSIFNRAGQEVRHIDPDGFVHLFAYNRRGEREVWAVDINRNGEIDYAGPDRIWRLVRSVGSKVHAAGSDVVLRTSAESWETGDSPQPTMVFREELTPDGVRGWREERGLITETTVVADGAGGWIETITDPAGLRTIRTHVAGRLQNEAVSAGAEPLSRRSYAYDPHGRVATVTDAAGGLTTFTYLADDRVASVTRPDPDPSRTGPGYDSEVVSYRYDSAGRESVVSRSGVGDVNLTYWPTGAPRRVWGAHTVPVEYAYDSQGRLRSLTTWQDFAADRGRAVTTWSYDPLRGWLVARRYPDGVGTDYRYSPAGRLLGRVGGRSGSAASYGYGPAGDLVRMEYADATPPVQFEIGRSGRIVAVTDGSGTRRLSYGATGAVESEAYAAGPLAGFTLLRGADVPGRQARLELRPPQGGAMLAVNYTYDAASRLTALTSGAAAVSYAYTPGQARPTGVSYRQGGVVRLTAQTTYDVLGRITGTTATGPALLAQHAYGHDASGLRSRVTREDNSVWELRHDAAGQLVGLARRLADGTPVPGMDWSWTFDDIGNRRNQRRNGALTEYSASLLNQYVQRSVPGVVEVLGWASASATVSVAVDDGVPQRATRQGELFWHPARVDNAVSAQRPRLTVTGVANGIGPAQEDAVSELPRWPYVPRTPELFLHDADGNRSEDASWRYGWDAENRLVSMETTPAAAEAGVPRRRLEFGYDALGRRVSKRVSSAVAGGWAPTAHTRFVYDGWNLVAELDALARHAVRRTLVWGNDLSGSLRGASGVGGLVMTGEADGSARFLASDGAGNVVAAVRADDGSLAARFDHTPWGEPVRVEGPWAAQNPWRFASRHADAETGLAYFGRRYLDPVNGRWLNRDPYGEAGGANLYSFVRNSPGHWTDPVGLALYAFDGTSNDGLRDRRDGTETNVFALTQVYTGSVAYSPGVGTHDGLLNPLGLAFGVGGLARIDAMVTKAGEFVAQGDWDADIVGFSRGAAQARAFANRLRERYPCVRIRWMGLFDTVASTGLPNDINLGYQLGIPAETRRVLHLTAGGERRRLTFALTSINPAPDEPNPNPGYREVEIPGAAHSDVGGGYEGNRGLANLSLLMMWQDGRANEVPFGPLANQYSNYVGTPHDSRWITDKFIELLSGAPRQRKVYYHP